MARKVGDLSFGLFATREYLALRGTPTSVAALGQHDLIGGDVDTQVLVGLRALGLKIDRDALQYRCDDRFTAWQLLNANCGIGIAYVGQDNAAPKLVQILPDLPNLKLPV